MNDFYKFDPSEANKQHQFIIQPRRHGKNKSRFKPGDTITDGETYVTIQYVFKDSYKTTNGAWFPIRLIDILWTLADDEGEIIE